MKKVLITGGSGFIGTNLIEKLLKTDAEVLSVDLSSPKIDSHKSIWKQVDLCDFALLQSTVRNFDPDTIIHLGARTDLNGKTLKDYDANIGGVTNLLKILDDLTSIEHVIFASSMYVCEPGYTPKDFEDYKPHTVYGESKVKTEILIKEKNPSYPWTIIRPTSIWGPHFGEPYNLFFKIVMSKKYFHLGEKACKKTYGYIDNFIYELLSILEAPKVEVDKKVFYLGDYKPYDITQWADEIAKICGLKVPTLPFGIFKVAGYVGDALKVIGIKFPMTSFRLKNMTTDNVFNLEPINKIAPNVPVSRQEGTQRTIEWLKTQ